MIRSKNAVSYTHLDVYKRQKVKYILSDEHQQLSEVYVMMKYDFYGEENEAI